LLDEAGLGSALQWYVDGFSDRSKIDARLEMSKNSGRLSNEMELSIFRVVQECLTNIHRQCWKSHGRDSNYPKTRLV
jgi:signal transduction histidine kinase